MMLNIAFHGLNPEQNSAMNLINSPQILVNVVNIPIEIKESH